MLVVGEVDGVRGVFMGGAGIGACSTCIDLKSIGADAIVLQGVAGFVKGFGGIF